MIQEGNATKNGTQRWNTFIRGRNIFLICKRIWVRTLKTLISLSLNHCKGSVNSKSKTRFFPSSLQSIYCILPISPTVTLLKAYQWSFIYPNLTEGLQHHIICSDFLFPNFVSVSLFKFFRTPPFSSCLSTSRPSVELRSLLPTHFANSCPNLPFFAIVPTRPFFGSLFAVSKSISQCFLPPVPIPAKADTLLHSFIWW